MELESRATANWQGGLTDGSGTTTLGSGLGGEFPMSWKARTEGESGKSSPEELLAAAHASCFSMALSKRLADDGHAPARLETTATVTFEVGKGVTTSVLTVRGSVPGIDEAAFRAAAEGAGESCPISKALEGNVEINVEPSLG